MNPELLTGLAALLVSACVGIVLPIVFRRQSAKVAREQEERQAKEQQLKDEAAQKAAAAATDVVSWEGINKALQSSHAAERVANEKRLLELRAAYADELDRYRKSSGDELERAKSEIHRLGEMVNNLREQLLRAGDQ